MTWSDCLGSRSFTDSCAGKGLKPTYCVRSWLPEAAFWARNSASAWSLLMKVTLATSGSATRLAWRASTRSCGVPSLSSARTSTLLSMKSSPACMPERTMTRLDSSTSISTMVTVAARLMTRLRHRPSRACLTENDRKWITRPGPQV